MRLTFILALGCGLLACSLLRAETAAELLDPNAPSPQPTKTAQTSPNSVSSDPTTARPATKLPLGTVDEPGFKASAKFASKPVPNYDVGTKNTNTITVPKKYAWSVPQEDGALHAEAGDVKSAEPENSKVVEDISPALAAAIAREKASTKPKEMIPIYQAISIAEKDNAAAHYRLGLIYVRTGDLKTGLAQLETAIILQPINPKYLCDFSIAALRAGWVEKAFAACHAAVSIAPTNARYLSVLGDVHLAAGNVTEALETYTRAIALEPTNSVYIYNMGLACMHARDFKRAQSAFEEAIKLKPNTSMYFASHGLACENLKSIKRAIESYNLALKYDKNNAYAHFLLAGVYSDPEDPTYTNRFEAMEHAEKAVKLTNYKNAQYLMGMARALRVARNYEDAIHSAKLAVDLEPARADYREELARYEKLNKEGFDK